MDTWQLLKNIGKSPRKKLLIEYVNCIEEIKKTTKSNIGRNNMYQDFTVKYITQMGQLCVVQINTSWLNIANDFQSRTGEQPERILSVEATPIQM